MDCLINCYSQSLCFSIGVVVIHTSKNISLTMLCAVRDTFCYSKLVQAFRPVVAIPWMIWRWKMMYTIKTGTTAITDPAITIVHSVAYCPRNWLSISGTVNLSGVLSIISGLKKSFHIARNENMPNAESGALSRGSKICQ